MDTGNTIALVAIGVPALGALLMLVFKAGGLNAKVDRIDRDIGEVKGDLRVVETRVGQVEKDIVEIKSDIKALNEKVAVLPSLVEKMAVLPSLVEKVNSILIQMGGRDAVAGASPRALTAHGRDLLEQSGIKEIVESRFYVVLAGVRSKLPENAYQVEAAAIEAVRALASEKELLLRLQDGAYKLGANIETLWLVGAIYIRDRILTELNFGINNTDKPPSTNNPA